MRRQRNRASAKRYLHRLLYTQFFEIWYGASYVRRIWYDITP